MAQVKSKLFVGLLIYQGLMVQEITGLKLKDVNLEGIGKKNDLSLRN